MLHGDVGPWNILWLDGSSVALIDFDEARPGERLEDVGYFAWKGSRLVADGPAIQAQHRRLSILAAAYGVRVDDDLLDAIETAVVWLTDMGRAEAWPPEALAQLEDERRWIHEIRGQLS